MSVRIDHGDADLQEVHEINVTPFIDVMLVLLIIFMIAAPLATVDVFVNLPTSSAQPQPRPQHPLYLTLKSDALCAPGCAPALTLGDTPIAGEGLASALDQATGGDKTQPVFVRADKVLPYQNLMQVMNLLIKAGYLKVGLVGLETDQH
jgi:biopolymer transport protein ExbD